MAAAAGQAPAIGPEVFSALGPQALNFFGGEKWETTNQQRSRRLSGLRL